MSMVSCTKERGGIYQGGVNGGASGKKLVKVAWLDYEENYGSSTYTHSSYEWERFVWSGNQLTDIMDGEYENGGPVEESYGGQFIYDGANLTEIREQEGDYQRNVYFTYNNGHITEIYRATVGGSYSSWYRENMTYSSDGHLQEVTGINSYGENYRYSLTWSGDNVISEQYFSDGSLLFSTNYTYDNKKSAYTEMPEWYIIYEQAYSMLSANNVLMANDFYGGESYNYSYTYTYDGEWPVKRILYEDNEKYTTFYEYSDGTGKSQMPQIYYINATANNSSWGNVYGSGEYAAGSTVILNAQAFSGYTFQQWSDGNTQNPRTFTANGNATYTAIFGTSGGGGVSSILYENFNNGIPNTWFNYDGDGDGWKWESSSSVLSTGQGYGGSECAASASFINNIGALTPNNHLISPKINIPSYGSTTLSWYVACQDKEYPNETYSVYVGHSITSNGDLAVSDFLYGETVSAKDKEQGLWRKRSVSLDNYKGQSLYIGFYHSNCTDQYFLLIDNIEVTNSSKSNEINPSNNESYIINKEQTKSHGNTLGHRRDKIRHRN